MGRNLYSTATSKILMFYRGNSDTHRLEITSADADGDVYVTINNTSLFLRREQARQFARALLEAAAEV